MTIHVYRSGSHVASYQGDESTLTQIGEITEELYPGSTLVLSDEDELTPEQIEILDEIADYQRELAFAQLNYAA